MTAPTTAAAAALAPLVSRLADPTRMPPSVRVGGLPAAPGRPDADPHTEPEGAHR